MRKLLLTTTALVAISGGTAIAADLPSKAVAPMVASYSLYKLDRSIHRRHRRRWPVECNRHQHGLF